MNMILGKRHIILAALVLVLGIAVYLNWTFGGKDGGFNITDQLEAGKNYGDAQYVGTDTNDGKDDLEVNASGGTFFSEARLTRQKSRDSAIDTDVPGYFVKRRAEISADNQGRERCRGD